MTRARIHLVRFRCPGCGADGTIQLAQLVQEVVGESPDTVFLCLDCSRRYALLLLEVLREEPTTMTSTAEAIEYNVRTAIAWGWRTDWFGCTAYNSALVQAVRRWQEGIGLDPDGKVGPATFRRKWTERAALGGAYQSPTVNSYHETLLYNTNHHPIDHDRVVLPGEAGGRALPSRCYTDMSREPVPREIRMGMVHWDACLSAMDCYDVMVRRSVSVHESIDNDGVIFQWLDHDHIAWHSGVARVNAVSVGVEVSNAFYLKYQDWYVRQGFGPRPLVGATRLHRGTVEAHLGFYDCQKEALRAWCKALSEMHGIPLVTPDSTTVVPEVADGTFYGFVHHYHARETKIDCAGLDLREILG